MPRAVDVVRKVAPEARPSYLAAFENGDALLIAHGLVTPDRLAHFLAQILHECGALTLEWENMNYRAERLFEVFGSGRHSAAIRLDEAQALAHKPVAIAERVYGLGNPGKAQTLGNTHPGDGFRYRGGGLMQTTGRANYRRMGQKCGVNFEADPELIVSAEHALKPALEEWTAAKLNAFADCNDILSISRAINLGNPRSTRTPNGIEDRVAWFAKVRSVINQVEFKATKPQPQPVVERPPDASGTGRKMVDIIADRIWRFGDQGGVVVEIQRALARLGYTLKGTGNFGINTQAAVAEFQARQGLEVDGEVGPETAKAMDAALAHGGPSDKPQVGASPPQPSPTSSPPTPATKTLTALLGGEILQVGSEGEAVRSFQLALAKLGYDLRGTGYFGGATDTAVTHFQETRGLEVDGEIGPETAGAIDAALSRLAGTNGSVSPVAESRDGGQPIWLIEGLKWIGTKEESGPASNANILGWARQEGGAIAKTYTHDSIPWCALFANMVLSKIGLRGTETLWALDWSNWGIRLAGPAVGAFAPMKRDGGGHIAIVVGRDQHGNLMCLGGNQSDAVNIKPFPADRPLSFRWPQEAARPASTGFHSLPLVKSDGRASSREA
jgi:uncharacterized protein (TIGR02594 family)